MDPTSWPKLGCGVGLRSQHYPVITNEWPRMDWFEAISENYMDTGGRPLHILEKVRHHYPVVLHGTSLSIGSTDPLNLNYLKRLKRLIRRIEPLLVSDHLCWSGVKGQALFDLLPLPFTGEALKHLVRRVSEVQDFLGREILLENVSAYVTYRHSAVPEWEFLSEISKRSGCGILLDINNLYVNSFNHGFDPYDYLAGIPGERVAQIHLAGHTDMGKFLFDTHSSLVIDPVWRLYEKALELWGPISTLIEWDEDIPPYEKLAGEAGKARAIYHQFEDPRRFPAEQPAVDPSISSSVGATPQVALHPGPSLADCEEWFRKRIQPQERQRLSKTPPSSAPQLLNPQAGDAGEVRVSVYANGYPARVRESLAETYEAVHHVLGDERFLELVQSYALRYPSNDYNINYVGRHLPEFLEGSPLTKDFPFLVDLARLERLIWNAFHAFDGPPLAPGELAGIPMEDWETARIVFQPSVSLMTSRWPVLDIWRLRHSAPEEAAKSNREERPQRILVGRKEDQVRCELLDPDPYRLLEGLLRGESLGALCERLAEETAGETLPVTAWFSRWVQDGLIARSEFRSKKSAIGLVA